MVALRYLLMGVGTAGLLAGCEPLLDSPRPDPRDREIVTPYAPSEESLALRDYYQRVEQDLLVQGLLRADGGGPDTPFTKRQLVDNFVQIGVFNEFTNENGRFKKRSSEARVQRWQRPIAISMEFGASVDEQQRKADTKFVSDFAARLSRVTGHRISRSFGRGNFHVAVLDTDELKAFGPRLQELIPELETSIVEQITQMARPTYCAVYAFTDADAPNIFHTAVAIIRSEHPSLLRKSCFHEEIAQGLGLSNDSPAARPSIFNDNGEFALLTRHDELLLTMLYDPRLPLGGTPAQAKPVIEVLAAELLGGES